MRHLSRNPLLNIGIFCMARLGLDKTSQSKTHCAGAAAVTAQQSSSKCGNNLAYGSDDFVETEWQCQGRCCFLEGADDFSSDENLTVFRCRKLLWGLEERDLTITSIMLHFVSNSRSITGVREEKCCSMVCLLWCCRNTFLFPFPPLSENKKASLKPSKRHWIFYAPIDLPLLSVLLVRF